MRNMYTLLVNSIIHENGKQLKNNVTVPVQKTLLTRVRLNHQTHSDKSTRFSAALHCLNISRGQ